MSAKHSKRACSEATSTLRARLAQAGDDDNAAVVEWLSSYETGTDICFHPTPAESTATVRLSFLKDVIRAFCVELSRSHPDESLIDINWTRGLRLSWLTRLLEIERFVGEEQLADKQPFLLLDQPSTPDRAECVLNQLYARWKSTNPNDTNSRFEIADQMVRTAEEEGLRDTNPRLASDAYAKKAEILAEQGDRDSAARAYLAAAELETDPEIKSCLNEMARILSG